MGYLFRRSTVQKSRDHGIQSHSGFPHTDDAVNVCSQRNGFSRNRECHGIRLSDARCTGMLPLCRRDCTACTGRVKRILGTAPHPLGPSVLSILCGPATRVFPLNSLISPVPYPRPSAFICVHPRPMFVCPLRCRPVPTCRDRWEPHSRSLFIRGDTGVGPIRVVSASHFRSAFVAAEKTQMTASDGVTQGPPGGFHERRAPQPRPPAPCLAAPRRRA